MNKLTMIPVIVLTIGILLVGCVNAVPVVLPDITDEGKARPPEIVDTVKLKDEDAQLFTADQLVVLRVIGYAIMQGRATPSDLTAALKIIKTVPHPASYKKP